MFYKVFFEKIYIYLKKYIYILFDDLFIYLLKKKSYMFALIALTNPDFPSF